MTDMATFLSSPFIDRLIDLALEEDLGAGDVTTQALIQIGRASCRERV